MPKKICILLLSLSLCLFTGCQNSRQIESAAIIENVSVDLDGNDTVYTFYRLSDHEKPWGVSVKADSFEKAGELAEREYIPNMSLAKLELLMINEKISREAIKRDIEYIATNSSFSPIAYVTLCDKKTMKMLDSDSEVQDIIEEQLILLKNEKTEACINYLSVFNSFERKGEEFYVPLIGYDGEIKVKAQKITA